MKPSVEAIHELPLPMVLAIAHLLNHTWIQQRLSLLDAPTQKQASTVAGNRPTAKVKTKSFLASFSSISKA